MHNAPDAGNDLIYAAEACDLLGVHRSTLTRMVTAGAIEPAVRGTATRAHLFRRRDVEALAAQRLAAS